MEKLPLNFDYRRALTGMAKIRWRSAPGEEQEQNSGGEAQKQQAPEDAEQ